MKEWSSLLITFPTVLILYFDRNRAHIKFVTQLPIQEIHLHRAHKEGTKISNSSDIVLLTNFGHM